MPTWLGMLSVLENLDGLLKLSQDVLAHGMSFQNRILHGIDVSYRSFDIYNTLLSEGKVQYFR